MKTVKTAIKRVLFLAVAFSFVCGAQAQQARKVMFLQNYDNAPYHFGFLLGVNFMNYSITLMDHYQDIEHPKSEYSKLPTDSEGFHADQLDHFKIMSVESYPVAGFSVGVIGDKRLGKYFNLRFSPTLSLSSKYVQYVTQLYDVDGNLIVLHDGSGNEFQTKTLESRDQLATFLEFPLHLKYRSKRYNNIGAYLLCGINPRLYLGSFKGTTVTEDNEGFPAVLQIKRTDLAFEFGTGFDIYNQWFKMGVEIKMSMGLLNVAKTDDWSRQFIYNSPLESVKNNQLQLSLTFE